MLLLLGLAVQRFPTGWERAFYDLNLSWLRGVRPPVSQRIAHLDVGMNDLKSKATTRQEYDALARMIEQARAQGAAVVVLDLLLIRGEEADFQAFWEQLQDDDVILASTWEEHSRLPKQHTASQGLVFMDTDPDGALRRYILAQARTPQQTGPSLALAALLKLRGQTWRSEQLQSDTITVEDASEAGEPLRRQIPARILFDQRANFEDKSSRNFIHFDPTQLEKWSKEPGASHLEGKVVFIAYVAPGSGDLCITPLDQSIPRVSVHAWALNDLMQDTWRQYLPRKAVAGLALATVILAWLLAPRLGSGALLVAWLLGLAAIMGFAALTMLRTHQVPPTATLAVAWTAALGLESYRTRKLLELRKASVRAGDDPLVGRTIGRLVLTEKLGQGGFATVYKALDEATMAPSGAVAVKVVHPAQAANPEFRRRFLREVRIGAQLQHPAIVRLIDSGEQDGLLFLTMELLRGRPLNDYLEQERPRCSLDEAMLILRPLLEGVGYAHQKGVLHRDLKPENVMVDLQKDPETQVWRSASVKVVDFGLAFDSQSSQITQSGDVLGTLDYLAPERIRGLADDARSDQYAVGIMAFEILSGQSPFPRTSAAETLMQRLTCQAPDLTTLRPDLPGQVRRAVGRMLALEMSDRYANLEDALADLTQSA